MKDIEGLSRVRKATDMVSVESGGVIFTLDGRLPEKDERLREGHVLERLPIIPNPLENLPSVLGERVVKQVVLGGFHRT
jgi:hypothetical protein